MQTLRFALRYAIRSLARGGDQTLLALLCVCFGVLAYTGTVLLSEAIDEAVLIPGPDAMGADAALLSPSGRFSPATADSTIALALAAGATAATPVASVPIGFLRAEGNGALTLVNRVMGIDPAAFPLAGPFQLRQTPHARTLSAALDSDQAAVLSRDVAGSLDLGIGDTLALAAGIGEAPTRFVIGGIAERTHDRNGSSVFLSLEGARRASGRTDLAGRVLVASPDLTALESVAAEAGLTVVRASPPDGKLADIFRLLLPAAGLLGLLLGGVGVANAMQVALARRREEIAVLKSIGYRRGELVALFTTETALLGLIGSVAGVVGGYGLAALLYAAFSGALPILVQPVYSVSTPLSGLLAGVVTTAIFGAGAIVRASEVRPSALLRQSVVPLRTASRAAMAGLGAALLGLYGVLAGLLIGSLVQGIGIVAFGTVGLVVLGGGMVLLLLALIRIPIGTYTGRLARRSLAHRPLRTAASLAALCTGVFAIALTASILQSARSQIDTLRIAFGYESVLVAGTLADSSAVSNIASETRTGLQIRRVVSLPVSAIRADSAGVGRTALPAQEIEGRALGTPLVNASIESGRGLEQAKEALAPRGSSLKPGDTAVVETSAGPEATFTIVGTYGPTPGGFLTRARGLIVPDTDLIGLGATSAAYLLPVPAPDVEPVAARLSERLPDAAVLTARAVNEYITRAYDGLFILALALASLSIGGGIVLIANSVGLSLLERRTEWAVLKSIGYTSRRILGLIASENVVLGLLAGAAGSGLAMLTAYLIGRALDAPLRVPPATAVTVALLCIALAALAALLAARGALNTRPGEALKG